MRLAEVYVAGHITEKSNIQNVFQKAFWHSLTFDTLSPYNSEVNVKILKHIMVITQETHFSIQKNVKQYIYT